MYGVRKSGELKSSVWKSSVGSPLYGANWFRKPDNQNFNLMDDGVRDPTVYSYYIFLQFAGLIGLSTPIVYVILPETKGLDLETIQRYFEPQKTVFYD